MYSLSGTDASDDDLAQSIHRVCCKPNRHWASTPNFGQHCADLGQRLHRTAQASHRHSNWKTRSPCVFTHHADVEDWLERSHGATTDPRSDVPMTAEPHRPRHRCASHIPVAMLRLEEQNRSGLFMVDHNVSHLYPGPDLYRPLPACFKAVYIDHRGVSLKTALCKSHRTPCSQHRRPPQPLPLQPPPLGRRPPPPPRITTTTTTTAVSNRHSDQRRQQLPLLGQNRRRRRIRRGHRQASCHHRGVARQHCLRRMPRRKNPVTSSQTWQLPESTQCGMKTLANEWSVHDGTD